jgi:PadR family transcriptional regulator, regulatory protein PadR
MPRRTAFSAQTVALLVALAARPQDWRHGYDLARETGLKSGTLYPILVRLADRGLVEARWEDGQPAGRPRRHLYRLSPDGLSAAAEAARDTAARDTAAAARQAPAPRRGTAPGRRPTGRPLTGEGS